MQELRDRARELVSIAEGEILKKEVTILALRKELKKAGETAKVQSRYSGGVRSEKCKGCIYKIAALKSLDEAT
ncbi:hypothetical protein ES703_57040 [subsurface metagenome]